MGSTTVLWRGIVVIVAITVFVVADADPPRGHCDKENGEGCVDELNHDHWNSKPELENCSPTEECVSRVGHCVKVKNDCDGEIFRQGCKGKKCKCCIPDDHEEEHEEEEEEEDDKPSSWPWVDPDLGKLERWNNIPRRVPFSREEISTGFYIHTRKMVNNHKVIAHSASTLDGTGFDATKPTKFIVHGFLTKGNVDWMMEMAEKLLEYGDYNVFRVDWGGGANIFSYRKAVSNTRVVGLEIGYLVNWLVQDYKLDPANVHLIGHSLGAHVSGYAGEQIPGLGRISGLDPAHPRFTATPRFVRLDKTDASFVDVYHTNAAENGGLHYGTPQAMGHIDFYPNGGKDQPHCSKWWPPNWGHEDYRRVGCSHHFAIAIFIDTIDDPEEYTATKCRSWKAFEKGKCGHCDKKRNDNNCSPVGIRASEYAVHKEKEKEKVKMFFRTD